MFQRQTTRRLKRSTARRLRHRRALTMLELMLVLALIVAIGALSLPSFRTVFEDQRTLKAGEMVRIDWNKARMKAMKTGQIQMFRYQAGGNTYHIEPYYTEQDWLEGSAQQSTTGPTAANPAAAPAMAAQSTTTTCLQRELPEGVVFAQSDVQADSRSLQIQQQMQGGSPVGQTAVAGDLPPVLFYPDGTTSDARVLLTNEHQIRYVMISLRSLTGIARVSELLSANELQTAP